LKNVSAIIFFHLQSEIKINFPAVNAETSKTAVGNFKATKA